MFAAHVRGYERPLDLCRSLSCDQWMEEAKHCLASVEFAAEPLRIGEHLLEAISSVGYLDGHLRAISAMRAISPRSSRAGPSTRRRAFTASRAMRSHVATASIRIPASPLRKRARAISAVAT